jgi:1-acyl-sn-glycerol-3-phosphate acyltransferase
MTYIKLSLIILYTFLSSITAGILALIDRSFRLYSWFTKIFAAGVLFISGIKVRITGKENIDPSKTYVLVCNHSSQYDIPAVQYAAAPLKVSIMYKKELNKVPFFGWQLAIGSYISVNRSNPEEAFKSIQKAKEMMAGKNISMLLFAEGTRSETGEIHSFKRGAFYLASRSGFPILPVTVNGTSKILPKGALKINSGQIHVHFDKPVYPKENLNKKEEVELMNNVREIIINNHKES